MKMSAYALKYCENVCVYTEIYQKRVHIHRNIVKVHVYGSKYRPVCMAMPLKWVYVQVKLLKTLIYAYICREIRHAHMKN